MLRIGLLGCGVHGERYLRHLLADVDGAQPVLFYRRDRGESERIEREYSVPRAASAEALLDSPEVDALLILTPPGEHLHPLRHFIDLGKPVLVEKPVLARWSDAPELSGLDAPMVMVAQSLRYTPVLQRIRHRLPELGQVHRIRAAQRLQPSPLEWQRSPEISGGGSITLTGVHLFDLLRWFVGRTPDAVLCRMQKLLEHPLENSFDACFEYEAEQILAATEVSKFGESRLGFLELIGTGGQLLVDYLQGVAWRVAGNRWEAFEDTGPAHTLIGVLEDFVRLARGEIPTPISLRDGMENVRMAEACYRSHHGGRRVLLADLETS